AEPPASQPAAMQLKLGYQNETGRLSGQPLPMVYGSGFVMVQARWTPVLTEKDNVYYKAWIRGQVDDWDSANAPKGQHEAGEVGGRKYAYLSRNRAGATGGANVKISFKYRPAGLSSFPLPEGGPDGLLKLPEAMPLPPGKYPFTFCVQRI